jgi:two-component system chemotaxis sensor kinase CheA
LRDEYIPVVRLYEMFGVEPDSRAVEDGLLVVVEAEGRRYGVLVDDLLAQQQVVIKTLETNYRQVAGVAGATILGDGTVALIIDVPGLVQVFNNSFAGKGTLAA